MKNKKPSRISLKEAFNNPGTVHRLIENDFKSAKYSKQERNAFLESIKSYSSFGEGIYRSAKLSEIVEQIGQLIESAEVFTLRETQDSFDQISVNKDLKELKTDFKLFQKTCSELNQLQQRAESLYEGMGHKIGKYYEI